MNFEDYIVTKSTSNRLIGYTIKNINIDKGVIVLIKNFVEKKLGFDYLKVVKENIIIKNSNIMIYLTKK
jgi:hypothetical protein